jgi:hypothetical protein
VSASLADGTWWYDSDDGDDDDDDDDGDDDDDDDDNDDDNDDETLTFIHGGSVTVEAGRANKVAIPIRNSVSRPAT